MEEFIVEVSKAYGIPIPTLQLILTNVRNRQESTPSMPLYHTLICPHISCKKTKYTNVGDKCNAWVPEGHIWCPRHLKQLRSNLATH